MYGYFGSMYVGARHALITDGCGAGNLFGSSRKVVSPLNHLASSKPSCFCCCLFLFFKQY